MDVAVHTQHHPRNRRNGLGARVTAVREREVVVSYQNGGRRESFRKLKRPRVLIFDEATSGLDEASAEHIGMTVNALKGQVTVVFVAHKVPGCLKESLRMMLG